MRIEWLQREVIENPGCSRPEMQEGLIERGDFISRSGHGYSFNEAKSKFLKKHGLSLENEAFNHSNQTIKMNWRGYYTNITGTYLRQKISGAFSSPNVPGCWFTRVLSDGIDGYARYWANKDVINHNKIGLIGIVGQIDINDIIESENLRLENIIKTNDLIVGDKVKEAAVYELIRNNPYQFLKDINISSNKRIKDIVIDRRVNNSFIKPDVIIFFDDNSAVLIEVQTSSAPLDAVHITKPIGYTYEIESFYNVNITHICLMAERIKEPQLKTLRRTINLISAEREMVGILYCPTRDNKKIILKMNKIDENTCISR